MLGEHQGINLPGTALSVPSLTEKDRKDLEFGLRHAVDMIAISFVRTAADVRETKRLIGVREDDIPVIAKLEKPQAIEHLEEILEVADGVMVARGDLGVEMPQEQVPIIQKHIIRRAAEWRKPVITATQMLESMVDNPRPTRAEVSDVANAVFDGSDAVMLSAETASGKYPRESVEMMGRIVAGSRSPHARSLDTATPPRTSPQALHFRNHLRIGGACRRGTGDARHRRLYRDGRHRTPGFEVPAQGVDLCFCAPRERVQPPEPVVGSAAGGQRARAHRRGDGARRGTRTHAARRRRAG